MVNLNGIKVDNTVLLNSKLTGTESNNIAQKTRSIVLKRTSCKILYGKRFATSVFIGQFLNVTNGHY